MKQSIFLSSLTAMAALSLSACAPSSETQPVSTPTPTATQSRPVVQQVPPPVQQPRYANYLDAPQTMGNWNYQRTNSGTQAVFRSAQTTHFAFNCYRSAGQIGFMRMSPGAGNRMMLIRTETGSRQFTASPSQTGQNVITARVSANDPFLDAMAITKGRVAIETGGMQTLYLPAWPELSRVIEDCR
ncbi:MAG: hypothetical protein ABJP34_06965 [Erythrobacter sp.]